MMTMAEKAGEMESRKKEKRREGDGNAFYVDAAVARFWVLVVAEQRNLPTQTQLRWGSSWWGGYYFTCSEGLTFYSLPTGYRLCASMMYLAYYLPYALPERIDWAGRFSFPAFFLAAFSNKQPHPRFVMVLPMFTRL